MSIPASLSALTGQWSGTNQLYFTPTDPAIESPTTMTVNLTAGEKFAMFQYTWAYDGAPQDDTFLVGCAPGSDRAKAVWIDSFHMQDQFMFCDGVLSMSDGSVSVKGSYPAPPGPDWG